MTRWGQHSAAWRLATPVTIAFAVGGALALFVSYSVIAQRASHEIDSVLVSTTTDLAAETNGVRPEGLTTWLSEERSDLLRYFVRSRTYWSRLEPPEVILVALNKSGRPLSWTGVDDPGPLLKSLPRRPHESESVFTVQSPDGRGLLRAVIWFPVQDRGLLPAVSEPPSPPLVGKVAKILTILWVTVVAIGGMTAWWSARRALRRVDRLRRAADAIHDPETGRRLEGAGKHDEIARLSETLNSMLDRIGQNVREVRDLSQHAAHDLRTPLTFIRGRLETALAHPEDDWREPVAQSIDEIDRLASLIQAMLDVAEAEGGALHVQRATFDLSQVCRDLVELYGPAAEERGIEVTSKTPLSLVTSADITLVQRALGNLLDNVLHHVRSGSRVVVEARRDDGGDTILTVEDSGLGFTEDVAPRAFEDTVRRAGSPGLGLGLSFVRTVARAHGGEAEIAASRLGGAAITLRFPSADPPR